MPFLWSPKRCQPSNTPNHSSIVISNLPVFASVVALRQMSKLCSTLLVIAFLLSHSPVVITHPIANRPTLASTARQNWFSPPPEDTADEFELIKPRLLAIYDKVDFQPPPSIENPYQQAEQPEHPSSYLLTFYTRDQTAYYAKLYQQETSTTTSTSNPYSEEENHIDDTLGCVFYHGHLVTPSKGYLAVTTCPNADEALVMSATIMLTTGQVLLIRPPPSPRSTRTREPAERLDKAYLQRRRGGKLPLLRDPKTSNCYMSEYEKRQVAIQDLDEGTKNRLGNRSAEIYEKTNVNPDERRQLVHQFGRHYLYRVSDKAPSINKATRKPASNYSSCTEKYFDEHSEEDAFETETPKLAPPTTESEFTIEYPGEESDDDEVDTSLERVDSNQHRAEHRLAKRDITKEDVYSKIFTIETIIFVDASLINRFNGNRKELQKLILAIMNEVQLIYNFDSLKIRVRVLIKQIVYLEGKDAPNAAEGDIDQYLDNFCAWQKRLWMATNRTARWDHALMLTGLDLYKKVGLRKNRKVLGLAWVNGMCRPAYSCTLNEGKNFEASYVIAHEMAHSLGMLHDGYDNNCDPEKYIMSEKTGPGKINWSPCSNLYLENFLTKSNMRCLESTRADQIKRFSDPFDENTDTRLPGEQYTLNQQCELALGKGYRAYTSAKAPFQDVCRELWCSSGTWATPAHPALEGSTCDRRKSCYQGNCVDKQRAFAQSKIKMYNNRRPTEPPSRVPASHDHHHYDRNSGGQSSSAGSGGPSFMRRVQRFLRSALRSVVGWFG